MKPFDPGFFHSAEDIRESPILFHVPRLSSYCWVAFPGMHEPLVPWSSAEHLHFPVTAHPLGSGIGSLRFEQEPGLRGESIWGTRNHFLSVFFQTLRAEGTLGRQALIWRVKDGGTGCIREGRAQLWAQRWEAVSCVYRLTHVASSFSPFLLPYLCSCAWLCLILIREGWKGQASNTAQDMTLSLA